MSKLTFHGNILSQPVRSCLWNLKTLGVEYEYKHVELFTGTRSEDYTQNVNHFQTVPVLDVDGTKLIQSPSIIRYIAAAFDTDGKVLPTGDALVRAQAEEILDLAATNARVDLMKVQIPIVLGPLFLGLPKASEEEEKKLLGDAQTLFGKLNTQLGSGPYFAGEKITSGDVHLFFELQNALNLLKIDLSEHPELNTWYETVGKDEVVDELTKQFLEALAAASK